MKHPNRLREIRTAKGLSLDKVAIAAGTSNQQLSRLERGERRLSHGWMIRLSGALGVAVTDVIPEGMAIPEVDDEDVELIKEFLSTLDAKRKENYRDYLRKEIELAQSEQKKDS